MTIEFDKAYKSAYNAGLRASINTLESILDEHIVLPYTCEDIIFFWDYKDNDRFYSLKTLWKMFKQEMFKKITEDAALSNVDLQNYTDKKLSEYLYELMKEVIDELTKKD